MATVYHTEFSDTSKLPKKEAKAIESKFPFIPPEDLKSKELCGQIVSKSDLGSTIKFCPICDFPMIVRILNLPCEHVMCYECSKPEKGYCYICEEKIEKSVRIKDMAKLYECDFPDCFKFFDSKEKLKMHKNSKCHGGQSFDTVGFGNMSVNMGMNMGMNVMNNRLMQGQFMNQMIMNNMNNLNNMGGMNNMTGMNNLNNMNTMNSMNNLNNAMIPNNLNNIINSTSPTNLNNLPGNNVVS